VKREPLNVKGFPVGQSYFIKTKAPFLGVLFSCPLRIGNIQHRYGESKPGGKALIFQVGNPFLNKA
jgi:hypothetical protein